jgi:DNA-directed RNA polymerase specialized sigma24 family protein
LRFQELTAIHENKNGMATSPPTQEMFDKLLLCLHPDRERAGEEYEFLRLKLLEYFRLRACLSAEDLADEVLNRLAKKITEGEDIRDLSRYCYGLARWVWIEYLNRPGAKNEPLDETVTPGFTPPDSLIREEREACFQHCLQKLAAGEQELIFEYCEHQNQPYHNTRREMAKRRQLTLVALRLRVCRIKDKLKVCFATCLEKGLPKLK